MKTPRKLAVIAISMLSATLFAAEASAQTALNVVLVHGAWADGSSWNRVTKELQRNGFNVVAAQIPLTSFSDDVAVLRKVLLKQEGPVVLAGHSYGGAVITAAATNNPKVKALVYIAAIVPDEGETVGDVFHRVPPHPSAPKLQPDVDGFLWLNVDAYRTAVAPDASSSETALMAATQKPIAVKCLGEPMTMPAWREKPTWFLIAEKDRMVSPETQFHGKENEIQICLFAGGSYSVGFKA